MAHIMVFISLLLSLIAAASGEPAETLTSEQFQDDGTVALYSLDGWYYHSVDDPAAAYPDSPSENRNPVNLAMPRGELPAGWDGIGWFRTTIKIDSTLYGRQMGLQGRIYGAMDVYLNGEKIGSAGTVGEDQETEETTGYFDPVFFTFDEQEYQYLAIRYSNHNYRKAWGRAPGGPLLVLGYADTIEQIYQDRRDDHFLEWRMFNLQMGFYLALAILHLILFAFYPVERANLIYGVMLLTAFLTSYFSSMLDYTYRPENFIRYVTGEGFFVVLFSVLNLFFVYEVTNRRINWLPVAFSLAALPVIIIIFTNPILSRQFMALFLYSSFLIAIGFIARDRVIDRRKDLNVILIAYVIFFILIIPRTLYIAFEAIEEPFLWADSIFLFQISGFLIPIGYSVYLARKIALTNRNLELKLEENERLSADKLRAEQEKQRLANRQKEELEKEVSMRTKELRKSLEDLKAAQHQLVQQEKLASLGQLTAGIAHEIKNPLNFVNNFSDLSLELLEEVRAEVKNLPHLPVPGTSGTGESEAGARGVPDEVEDSDRPQDSDADTNSANTPLSPKHQGQAILEILDDIEANLRKIHEHGSRADGIVKSMLQHSRGGSGKMEPVKLNDLIREYVNLSFHGMRAGKTPINVDIDLQLDAKVGEVPLIVEDFSRVVLNLCNNAFDAMREKIKVKNALSDSDSRVSEKAKELSSPRGSEARAEGDYKPKLIVRTRQKRDVVLFEVEDNGPGIPKEIRDKILQPFFTTKKGREGTGLGLSITNDIVKAHGGSIEIESEPDQFTRFRIHLKSESNV